MRVLSDDEPSSGSSEEEHRMLCLCHVYVGPRFQGHLTDIEFGALDILCGQALGPDLHGLSLHLLDGRCEIHTHYECGRPSWGALSPFWDLALQGACHPGYREK